MVAFATQVKRRRGTTAQNDAFTGAEGEIVVDTEKHTLRVHDGETQGGFEMARQSDVGDKADTTYVNTQLALKADTDLSNIPSNYDYVIESQMPTAGNGYTWYRKYKSGWVEQGGVVSGTAENNPVSMPIEMSNTEYQVLAIADPTDSVNSWGWIVIVRNTKTTTGFSLGCREGPGNVLPVRTHWQVSGMSAQ